MNFKLLIYTLSLILLSACDDSSTKELTNLIESNQKIWDDSGISSYTFTYYSPPNDCPSVDPFPAVEITIVDNVITELYVPDLDSNLDIESQTYPTIDDVFENMLNSVEYIQGTPLFDETFGFPLSYMTDMSDSDCDGYSITISSFM